MTGRTRRWITLGVLGCIMAMLAGSALAIEPIEVAKLVASDGEEGDQFGSAIDLDGDTLIVGANFDDRDEVNEGSAYIFVRDGSGVWLEEAKLVALDGTIRDEFGVSVSVSGDTALVGAWKEGGCANQAGAAYVFRRDSGVWPLEAKLLAFDCDGFDHFGYSVSLDGDTALIGAIEDGENGYQAGAAYVFTRASGIWSQQAKLLALDGESDDAFGWAVALDGDTALIGVLHDDDKGTNSGSAYVFTRDAVGIWSQEVKLLAADGELGDTFGFSVALDGDTAIVGAQADDDNGLNAGSVYVFERDVAGDWSQQDKLIASPGPTSDDLFGHAIALNGDAALITAFTDDDRGFNSGAAYVFTRDTVGVWTQQAKILASDGSANDWFGWSAVMAGNEAMVGAMRDDNSPAGVELGAVFVFELGIEEPSAMYSCAGFEPPMDNSDIPVAVRKKRALPLKAHLYDEAGEAVDDQAIVQPPVLRVLFSPEVGGDPIDVTDDALAAGHGSEGNQFAFSGDRWQFNLKTDNYTASGTYELSMVSGDGYVIDPSCRALFEIN